MSIDYPAYLDALLVAVADRQTTSKIQDVNLRTLHSELFPDAPESWLDSAATALFQSGYGIDWLSTDNMVFLVNGAGLKRAAEIRNERTRKTFRGRIASVSRSEWMALAALIVSVIAIFKN